MGDTLKAHSPDRKTCKDQILTQTQPPIQSVPPRQTQHKVVQADFQVRLAVR